MTRFLYNFFVPAEFFSRLASVLLHSEEKRKIFKCFLTAPRATSILMLASRVCVVYISMSNWLPSSIPIFSVSFRPEWRRPSFFPWRGHPRVVNSLTKNNNTLYPSSTRGACGRGGEGPGRIRVGNDYRSLFSELVEIFFS